MSARANAAAFVGRSHELARLEDALDRAEADASITVVLVGEAGIGKSRLLRELEMRSRERGWSVISGDCVRVGAGGLPYGPIVDALGSLVAEVGEDTFRWLAEPAQAPIGRLLPDLVDAGRAPPLQGDLDTAQWRLFGSVLTLLERLGEDRGVLFTIDDVQWSDRSTRELLRFLAAALRSPRIVLALAARSGIGEDWDEMLPFLGELWRQPRVERIDVRQFDRAEVAAHLTALNGRRPAVDDVDAMLARSDGNPFYIEVLAGASEGDDPELPSTLKDVVMARIAELGEDARVAVESAAIAGRVVDHDLLAEAAGLPHRRLSSALREAIDAGVLEVDPPGERYRFHHALQQEAVSSRVLPADRRRLHLAYARILEGRPGRMVAGRAAEIAHHLDLAREPLEAIPALIAAGKAAIELYAFHQALGELERALALLELNPEAAGAIAVDRVALLELAADAAANGGLADHAVTLGRRAVELDDASDARRLAMRRARLADHLLQVGQIEAGLDELRRATVLVEQADADPERAMVSAAMARALMLASDLTAAVPLAERAIDLARAANTPVAEASSAITLGVAQAGLGELDQGLANLRRGLALSESLGASGEMARAYLNLNYALWSTGHVSEALAVAQQGIRHAQRQGAEWTWGVTLVAALGELLYDLGRWAEAESMFLQASERHASATAEIDFRRSLAQLRIGQGRLGDARRELEDIDALTESLSLHEHATWEGFLHASLAVWSGDWRGARAAVDAALARMVADDLPFEGPRLAAMAVRADAELALIADARHDGPAAAEARSRARAMVELVGRLSDEPAAHQNLRLHAYAALVRAEAQRANLEVDPAAWRAARDGFEAIPMPFEASYATMRLGESLVAIRERARAGEMLRGAHRSAVDLGARLLVEEVSGLARRARIPLDVPEEAGRVEPDPAVTSPLGLTARELDVLRLLGQGRTNRQIASELFVSVKTAGLHVSNILAKLDVTNRVEAAGVAHRLGIGEERPRPA